MNELSIWALKGDEAEAVEAVDAVSGLDLENRLEETLVRHPNMLEPNISLVGRQTPTDGGPSDLLGVDASGRLVVFELKRERLTRDAVTQCIDYASALDAMDPEEELAKHIAEHSGTHGIEKIDDFTAWYRERYEEQFAESELSSLLPPRLVLVGLGVDDRAERMAQFLQARGVDISVLTFYGFQHGGETLLARQVEVEHDSPPPPHSRRNKYKTTSEKQQDLEHRLAARGLTDLFEDIRQTVATTLSGASLITGPTGINFSLRFGSGIRRILGIKVVDTGGISLEFDAQPNYKGQPEIYEPAALSTITEKAFRVGWSRRPPKGWDSGGDNFALFIKDAEEWEQKRSAIVDFLKEALALRLKAPATDAS